ncbi:unnamed protein product [Protopolystoma xenopodis]|uniref:Uncharacterized protein n=1 Tax=Protopolystoma xenopodis TaxID=117903 RepID=A0A3S5C2P5_9PLAT|nr:unnamed protein product [Protopolystoma xenopodis]
MRPFSVSVLSRALQTSHSPWDAADYSRGMFGPLCSGTCSSCECFLYTNVPVDSAFGKDNGANSFRDAPSSTGVP